MSNKLRGNVDLKVGDAKYTLCFDHGALIELEDQLDCGIVKISTELQSWSKDPERVRLKWVRALLYAGLKRNHPRLSLDDVSDILTEAGMEASSSIMVAVGEALNASFGSSEVEGKERPTSGDTRNGAGESLSPSTSPSVTN